MLDPRQWMDKCWRTKNEMLISFRACQRLFIQTFRYHLIQYVLCFTVKEASDLATSLSLNFFLASIIFRFERSKIYLLQDPENIVYAEACRSSIYEILPLFSLICDKVYCFDEQL